MDKTLKFVLWTAGILGVLGLVARLFLLETWTVPDGTYMAVAAAPTGYWFWRSRRPRIEEVFVIHRGGTLLPLPGHEPFFNGLQTTGEEGTEDHDDH